MQTNFARGPLELTDKAGAAASHRRALAPGGTSKQEEILYIIT
jgi:hypothetical protein